MAKFADSVLFLPAAGGTTDFTVSAAVTGFMTPALAGMPSGTYKYRAESTGLTQWEIGEGVYNSGTGVLTRATVLYNSSGTGTATGQSGAGSKINFSAPPNVGVVQLVEDTLGVDQANSWSAAQKIQAADNIAAYRKGNIVGTVSQSGGVPTGAIIEQGSNANGNYVKYADGTQLCWGALIRTGVAINNPSTTSGCHFENSAQTITFPAVFIAAPSFTHSENSGNLMWTWGSPPPTTTQGSLRLVSASLESSRNSHICWQASGRWF